MNTEDNIFIGRLGKNPDLRYTLKKEAVCYLSVAVNIKESQVPEWKRVIVWGRQAELCNLYLKKGKQVFVHGQNTVRQFKSKDGELRSIEEFKAKLVGFTNV